MESPTAGDPGGGRQARLLLGLGAAMFERIVSLNDEGFIVVASHPHGQKTPDEPTITYANDAYLRQVSGRPGHASAYPLPASIERTRQVGEQVLSSGQPAVRAVVHPGSGQTLVLYAFPVKGSTWAAFTRYPSMPHYVTGQKPRLVVDTAGNRATWGPASLDLTATEHAILAVLVHASGAMVSREEMAAAVWKGHPRAEARLDPHISRLRRKMREAGMPDEAIRTLRQHGYSLRLST